MKDKTALLSGASKGIGLALVKHLTENGVKVAVCARNIQPLVDLFTEMKLEASQFYVKSVDVRNTAEILSFVDEAEDKFGNIDYLFNNVGMNTEKAEIFNITSEAFDAMYAVNMRAPMIFTREVSKLMIAKKTKGTIINIQTTCDLFSNPTTGSYTSSKAGFDALSKVFRKELREYEIKVLNIYPGGVDTAFREADRSDYLRPENVADAVVKQLSLADEIYIDDIVLRPLVEKNY
ncbi:MAG: SDR family NAD(P)-dependent oxidoreductase [Bacteroidales bacterium]|jgi:NAD(P)-dependent dehydrogenase (short-subunit alcohol dehydrogenase family)|nr:SDR family NAD(P)-dependent oxidoreductase [Bacteroidales bacterium]